MLIYLLDLGLLVADFICIFDMLNVPLYCSGDIMVKWGDLIYFDHRKMWLR